MPKGVAASSYVDTGHPYELNGSLQYALSGVVQIYGHAKNITNYKYSLAGVHSLLQEPLTAMGGIRLRLE